MRAWAALLVLLLSAPARAQPPPAQPPEPPAPRPMPDYGRASVPAEPAEALLWIPRVLFAPVHLVIAYGVREPLRWLLRAIELERLDAVFEGESIPGLDDAERQWWFGALVAYDHGLLARAGVTLHARDADDEHRLGLALDFWGTARVQARATGAVVLERGSEAIEDPLGSLPRAGRDRTWLELMLTGARRTDRIFHGFGWSSPARLRTRYADALGELELALATRFLPRGTLHAGARVGLWRFEDTSYRQGEDRSLERAAEAGSFPLPPGFAEGYTVVEPWVRAELDTRSGPRRALVHGTGLAVALHGAWALDAQVGLEASWTRVGGAVELSVEVLRQRTLALRASAEAVASLGERPVPFTEQLVLGGALDRLPGFLPGRLVDRSTATLGLAWRYAIWAWLDLELFADVGNVFAAGFADFEVERLRLSFGGVMRTHDEAGFTLLVAAGTEPFVRVADITSARVAFVIGAPP